MGIFVFVLLLLLPVAGFGAPTEADADKDYQLDEVSVTASRIERNAAEVPASVAVISEDQIEDSKMFNLKDAITATPGVLIDTRNQGYDSRLIIRGAGLKARYGVREIMVLLDGVPITDPDSLTRLDFVDTQLIESIEIVKGPNSTLWGANAAGGVINIRTKSPLERTGGTLRLAGGDFNTQSYHLSYSESVGDTLYFTASGSRRQSDNSWRRRNKFWTNQISLLPSVVLSDGAVIETIFSYTKASLQLPGSLDAEQFERYKDTGRARESSGPWQFSGRYSEILFLSSKLTKTIGELEFVPLIYVNKWRHFHPVTGRINDADTWSYGTDLQVNMKHKLFNIRGTATAGTTLRYDDQKTDYSRYRDIQTTPSGRIQQVLSDRSGDFLEHEERQVLLWGVYAQESIYPSEKWAVDAGLRYDLVKFDIESDKVGDFSYSAGRYLDCPDPGITNCGHHRTEKTYHSVSPRIAATYKLSDHLHVFGSFSTGIQTPTESELSENPDLDLVTSRSYEIGLKGRHDKWSFDTSLYYSPVEDEVVRVIQEDDETAYVNAGETRKTGFEFAGTYYPIESLGVGASYSYTEYEFEEFTEPVRIGSATVNLDRDGNRLPFVPEHQYSLFAHFRHAKGWKFRVETNSWGSYYVDNANSEKYGGYDFVTNVMAGYEWGSFDLALNVDNVFDKHYAVEVTKDSGGEKDYSPAAPRSFVIRLAYTF